MWEHLAGQGEIGTEATNEGHLLKNIPEVLRMAGSMTRESREREEWQAVSILEIATIRK
jgi:hypothetical protein